MLGGVEREREGGSGELLAQLAVGKAVQDVLAAHQDLEERAVLARHGVERAHRATVGGRGPRTQSVECADGGRGVVDVRQRREVATVALPADLSIARQKGDAFAQGDPRHHGAPVASHAPADAKLCGVVDHRLDPQHRAFLVVQLHPVALHPVFHPPPGQAFGHLAEVDLVGDDVALEVAVHRAAEKRQDMHPVATGQL